MQQSLRQNKAAKGATSEVVEIQDEEEEEVEKALDEAIAKKKEEAQESSDDLTSASEESSSEKTVSDSKGEKTKVTPLEAKALRVTFVPKA